jgi:hypothetical protein
MDGRCVFRFLPSRGFARLQSHAERKSGSALNASARRGITSALLYYGIVDCSELMQIED